MPTIVAHHDVNDTQHWLASPKREEFFGSSGSRTSGRSSTLRTRTHVAVLMDVPDMDALAAAMEKRRRRRRDGTTTVCCPSPS